MTAGNALAMAMRAAVCCLWTVSFEPDHAKTPSLHSWVVSMRRGDDSLSCCFGGDDMAALSADWIREVIRTRG